MIILAIIDFIMLSMVFLAYTLLPQPWYDNKSIRDLWPLIQVEKQVINDYVVKVWPDFFDTSKEYSLHYDKNLKDFVLKDWCGKMLINTLWVYLGSQTIGTKYCIKVKSIHPLEFETIFPDRWNLIIKSH